MMPRKKKFPAAYKLFIALVEEESVPVKKENIIKCLDEGANVNQRFANDSYNTPLHVSVINGDLEIANLLLQRGANINYRNSDGKTALDIAKEFDSDVRAAMIELLEKFESEIQTNEDAKQSTTSEVSVIQCNNPNLVYNKRAGTSGIKRQLFEFRLLSLVFIRASLCKEFDEFYLGTDLDDIGAFNDVCMRYVQDGIEGVVFLLTKYTNDVNKAKITKQDLWTKNGQFSLHKYFYDYLKIIKKLQTATDVDALFKLKTTEIHCTLAVYTTAEIDLKDKRRTDYESFDKTARDLICSADYSNIYRYKYDENDVALLTDICYISYVIYHSHMAMTRKMTCIGESLASCIITGDYNILFSDACIRKFHVVLAQNVIKVSEITDDGYRVGKFRREFLCSYDSNLVHLKFTIFASLVAAIQIDKVKLSELIEDVCSDPTAVTISKLMQNILITHDRENNILCIKEERFRDITYKLSQVKVTLDTFTEAYTIAINEIFGLVSIKLPSIFGNIDIAVDDEDNCMNILVDIATKLTEIIRTSINPISNQVERSSITVDCVKFINFNNVLSSAVGNLLILDETKKRFKFNMDEHTLGSNAKIVLKILKSQIKPLDNVVLKIKYPSFPKLTLEGDEEEINAARIFFDMLCFYTCQSKEDEIEVIAKNAIQDYCVANIYEPIEIPSNAQYNAVNYIIHNAVQKWSLNDGESYYLEHNREFIDKLLNEFSGKSLLYVISHIFVNRMRQYDISFNKEAIDYLNSQIGTAATVLITEVDVLTGIKLTQCFTSLNSYAFVELNDTTCLSKNDYYTIIEDLKSIKLRALIILYDDITNAKTKIFLRLTEKSVSKNYILVTSEKSAAKLRLYITNETYVTVKDARNDLKDLAYVSQEKVLGKTLMFQGELFKFSTIMTPESKALIKAKVLQKIVKNDIIDIGKILTNSYYEEIKQYYVQRHLYRIVLSEKESIKTNASTSVVHNEEIIEINTLETLKDTVVIVGAPGMGKSTFLTYLSIETKRTNSNVWIERINLLDQTKYLHRLQKNKVSVNKIEALKFICKAAVSRNQIRFSIKPTSTPDFDLEINNGEVVLKNCDEIDYLLLFELEMFIHFYNQGRAILLFDGFDEICPHYKKEMTEILKCLVMRYSSDVGCYVKQRMWITSRSYNNIRETLENEFGVAYHLKMFTSDEKNIFMIRYFSINLKINELNIDQFKNIDGFFEFMKDFVSQFPKNGVLKFYKLSTIFLQQIYFNAMNYLIIEANKPLLPDKKVFTKKWASIFEAREKFFKVSKVYSNFYLFKQYKDNAKTSKATLICTPLHIYIVMNYFISQIKTVNADQENEVAKKWDFDMSTLSFYKYFIELKMKKIRFEDKNQMDIYNPDIKMIYQRELKEFTNKHKKLAFYATFMDGLDEVLAGKDIEEIHNIIQDMKSGREKTGVVDSILSDGIPKFVHRSFQEYLAVEHLVDLLKRKECDQSKLWKFIINKTKDGFLDFFDRKIEYDNKLMNVITEVATKEMIFKKLTHSIYSKFCNTHDPTIMDHAINLGLKQITKLLLTAIADLINIDNLNQFIFFIKKSKVFRSAVEFGWNDILCIIFSCIRKVDAKKLSVFNPGILKTSPYNEKSNVEIIRDFKWQMKKYKDLIIRNKRVKPRSRHNTI